MSIKTAKHNKEVMMTTIELRTRSKETWSSRMVRLWPLYIMAAPGIAFIIIFKCIPLIGTVIAFQDYSVFKGFFNSPWVGFKHFEHLLAYPDFHRVFTNTLILGLLKVILLFPFPIILAILINEVERKQTKRLIQTAFYIPHFFSWVIVAGLIFDLLSTHGLVNQIRGVFGAGPELFMQQDTKFRMIYIVSSLWKESGWGTIVYLAALSGLDPQVYESAMIDGANKLKQIIFITVPLLIPTILILFLLNIGSFMELGFDHIYNILTPMTYSVGDVIDTYVFRNGIQQAQYSYSTAVGLFQSVIGFILVFTFNKLSNKFSEGGLW